jgi:hypothetical protein
MPNIIISAHAGRWSNQRKNLRVPAGSAVVYYVSDGGLLSNSDGYSILDNLQAGNEPGGAVAETVIARHDTYDYACWFAPEFAADCGIFEVGSDRPLASLDGYTEDAPLPLGQILESYSGCTIYWVCCREVTAAGRGHLTSSGDAFPSGRPLDLRAALRAAVDRLFEPGEHTADPVLGKKYRKFPVDEPIGDAAGKTKSLKVRNVSSKRGSFKIQIGSLGWTEYEVLPGAPAVKVVIDRRAWTAINNGKVALEYQRDNSLHAMPMARLG